jgi:hypothetical protein
LIEKSPFVLPDKFLKMRKLLPYKTSSEPNILRSIRT